MCGIVGFIGRGPAVPVLLGGLRRLEYRGYDSAGIACLGPSGLQLRRATGKLDKLAALVHEQPVASSLGIGHTRWATHGKPSEANAHPHVGSQGRIAVVHNGIIENYLVLRQELQAAGFTFKSQTDSEVLAHLIERGLAAGLGLTASVRQALHRVTGTYALVVIDADAPDKLVAARLGSPLVVGLGEGSNYLASDVPAILEHTREVIYLDDGELVELSAQGCQIFGPEGEVRPKLVTHITWDPVQAEKAGYPHFMLKEVFEQPRAIEDTLRGRLLGKDGDADLEQASILGPGVQLLQRIVLIGCGTSWHACLAGKYLIEDLARLTVEVDIASEFRYRNPILGPGDLVVGVSQSGETADTLAALKLAKDKGASTLAICNVVGASLSRLADGTLSTHAGPEIGVASTKAFSAQLAALFLLALRLGRQRGTLSLERGQALSARLRELPRLLEQTLKLDADIQALAALLKGHQDFLFLGRGINTPIALEGALKLKEISYLHAEGYAAGEMKHGPIALLDEGMPVVALATRGSTHAKLVSNLEEACARGAKLIAFCSQGDLSLQESAFKVLYVPDCPEELSPFLNVIPLQLLAYHLAVNLGRDVDQPRNLAKSVTVE